MWKDFIGIYSTYQALRFSHDKKEEFSDSIKKEFSGIIAHKGIKIKISITIRACIDYEKLHWYLFARVLRQKNVKIASRVKEEFSYTIKKGLCF